MKSPPPASNVVGVGFAGALLTWVGLVTLIHSVPPDPQLAIALFLSPALAAVIGIGVTFGYLGYLAEEPGQKAGWLLMCGFVIGLPLVWLWSELVQMLG